MKPFHFSALEENNNKDNAFCFRSDVWKPGDPSTYVATGTYKEMVDMKNSLNAELIEKEYKDKKFTRYVTRWYITIDYDEALRLCALDHCDPGAIKITENVELLHNHGFSIWSDGKIAKTTVSNAPTFFGIAKCADELINILRGSDTGESNIEGGMFRLSQIVEVGEEETILVGASRGVYNTPKVKKFPVKFSDGKSQMLFSTEAGYFEGYAYNIYEKPMEAFLENITGSDGIEEFSGYEYDSLLGFVKK